MKTKTIDRKIGYFGNYGGQFMPPHLEEKLNKLYQTFFIL